MKTPSLSLPALASLLLFMLCCATLAYWSTRWLAPAQRPVAAPAAMPAVDTASLAGLFGRAQAASASSGDFQLKGVVVAPDDADSLALIQIDGQRMRSYRIGAELRSGVRVAEIHASHVVLEVGGASQQLALPKRGAAGR